MLGAFSLYHNSMPSKMWPRWTYSTFPSFSSHISSLYTFFYSFIPFPHFFASTYSHVPRFLTIKSDSLVPIISVNKISLKLPWEDIACAMGFNALLCKQKWQLTNMLLTVQCTDIQCQTLNCSTASFKSSCRGVCRETYQSFCRERSMSCGDMLARNLPFI